MGVETLLIASIAATAVGTGVSAYAARQQGKVEQQLHNYNAQVRDQQASDSARDARIIANNQRLQAQRLLSKQRAKRAAQGVVVGTGTPLLVEARQAGELEMAALESEIAGNVEAGRLRQQAVFDRMSGSAARKSGNLQSTATILSGAASIASTVGTARYKGMI